MIKPTVVIVILALSWITVSGAVIIDGDTYAAPFVIEPGDSFSSGLVDGLSQIDIVGGEVTSLELKDESKLQMSSGNIAGLEVRGASTVELTGGSIHEFTAFGSGEHSVTGESVDRLDLRGTGGTLHFSGTDTTTRIRNLNGYTTSIVGGDFYVFSSSGTMNIEGGNLVRDSELRAIVNFRGGNISGRTFTTRSSAQLNFYAQSFVGIGEGLYDSDSLGIVESGDSFTFQLDFGDGLQSVTIEPIFGDSGNLWNGTLRIVPVPEPHEYALVAGLGLAGLVANRRTRRKVKDLPSSI